MIQLLTLGVIIDNMISSFKCKETQKLFHGRFSRKLPQDIQRIAARKLEQLHAATPNNHLKEAIQRHQTFFSEKD